MHLRRGKVGDKMEDLRMVVLECNCCIMLDLLVSDSGCMMCDGEGFKEEIFR